MSILSSPNFEMYEYVSEVYNKVKVFSKFQNVLSNVHVWQQNCANIHVAVKVEAFGFVSIATSSRFFAIGRGAKILPTRYSRRRSQWPRGLRLTRTLGSWVRIPLEAWMFVLCAFILCVGRGFTTGWSPSKKSYRLCIGSRNWKAAMAQQRAVYQ
jgi:hypothetical protein